MTFCSRPGRKIFPAVWMALLLASCRYDFEVRASPSPDGPRFAVGPAISLVPRRGPRCVDSVIVYPEGSRRPVWMIERVEPCPSATEFSYGAVPAGWRETVPAEPLRAGSRYEVAISGSGSGGGTRFRARGEPVR